MEGLTPTTKDLMVIDNKLVVTNIRNPFDPLNSREIKEFPIGLSIQECIDAMVPLREGYDYVVSLNGTLLDPSLDFSITKPIGSLAICTVPQGGGGGKDVFRIVAMLAVIVISIYAPYAAPAAWGLVATSAAGVTSVTMVGAMVSAAVMVAGSLLVNALLPVQTPDMNGAGTGDYSASSTYGWQVEGNTNREGVCFPILYGTSRISPPIISKYIEVLDDKQYMNILYAIADHAITSVTDTSVRINENAVTKGEEGIEWETRLGALIQSPIQYFGDTRTTKIAGGKVSATWTTISLDGTAIEGFGVALVLPRGLFYAADNGTLTAQTLNLDIEFKLSTDSVWTRCQDTTTVSAGTPTGRWSGGFWDTATQTWVEVTAGSANPNDHVDRSVYSLPAGYWYVPPHPPEFYVVSQPRLYGEWRWLVGATIYTTGAVVLDYTQITAAQASPIRKVYYRDRVPVGSYQIRVRFHDGVAPPSTSRYANDVYLEYTETILYDDFEYPNTSLFALRALATDKYSGSLPSCDFVATRSTVQVWTGAAYEEKDASNPAWAAYDILHNPVYGGGVPYSRISYADFALWAAFCITKGFTCNIYFDTGTNLRKALNMIGLLGRGSVVQLGSMFTCFVDKEVTIPAQSFMFNVGNIATNSFNIEYMDLSERANAIDVTYWDATDFYNQKTIEVHANDFDSTTQEVKKTSLSLIGCTDRDTALKQAFFFLNNNRLLTTSASWETDIDALACLPWDVVEVQHDVTLWGEGGRTVSATANTITLDKPIIMESGKTYTLGVVDSDTDTRQDIEVKGTGTVTFTAVSNQVDRVAHGHVDGTQVSFSNTGGALALPLVPGAIYYIRDASTDYFKLASALGGDVIDLSTDGSGTTTLKIEGASTLTVTTPFSIIPALHDLWTVTATGKATKYMRIMSIGRKDDLTRKIVALEYNVDVYDDSGTLEPPESPATIVFTDNLRATEIWGGVVGTDLLISWTGFATSWYVKYKVASSATWILLGVTSQSSMILIKPSCGIEYTINVSHTQEVLDGETIAITPTGVVGFTVTDGNGIVIDGTGIHVHSDTLGESTVHIYSDGSQPVFSSPKIEMSTTGVIQTAAGIGDGVINAAGIKITKDGIYACELGQLLANANVRILSDGTAHFSGEVSIGDATSFMIGTGIWMGEDLADPGVYKLHIGNPESQYIKWDGEDLTLTGVIVAEGCRVPGNKGHREGMIVTVKDATNLYVSGGSLEIDDVAWGHLVQATVPMGSTTPDTHYYLYASVVDGVWTFTVSETVPVFSDALGASYMTGDTTKRWLANIKTAA